MNTLEFFLSCLLGAILGVALVSLFHRPSRRHAIRNGCMALAVPAALTLWRYLMLDTNHSLLLLPLFGAVGGGVGFAAGMLLERKTRSAETG